MEKVDAFEYEKNRLEMVVQKLNARLEHAQEAFDKQQHHVIGFTEGLRGTQFNRQAFMSMYATEIYELELILQEPYFAKFQFENSNTNSTETIYIGKRNVTDEKFKLLAQDWRSPICSMYYDYNIGEDAVYTMGSDKIRGKISGKRQINIKNGQLISVEDQDVLSMDDILVKYLSESNSARLKSIVSTIQKEQNAIIRNQLRGDKIIQGVAGSGKTTVALHKLSYMLYNEADKEDNGYLILGPNKYFLNYISTLLPELDIKNIDQMTFEELIYSSLRSKIESPNETLKKVLDNKLDDDVLMYKSSIQYLKTIEKYVNDYVISHISDDIKIKGITIENKDTIMRNMSETSSRSDYDYTKRMKVFTKKMSAKIKDSYDYYYDKVIGKYKDDNSFMKETEEGKKEFYNNISEIREELKKGCVNTYNEYFKFLKIKPIELYKEFINDIEKYTDSIPVDIERLKKDTLESINSKKLDVVDMTVMLYIKLLMSGMPKMENYKHIIIDEAQDLSLSQYYILKKLFPIAEFDIYGDINQSIYGYKAIRNWEELNESIFDNEATQENLNKSYRATKQISDVANIVLEYNNWEKADYISRDGKDVIINKYNDNQEITIISELEKLLESGYKSIAIITKDAEETTKLHKEMNKSGLKVSKVTDKDEEYSSGICIVPSYLSKGLEFDAVIIYDANEDIYTESYIDNKLLYVALTRAMHELVINYSGQLTKPLASAVKEKNKQLIK